MSYWLGMRGVYTGVVHLNVTIGNRNEDPISIDTDQYSPGCVILNPINEGGNVTFSQCGGIGTNYESIHGVCQYKECLTVINSPCSFPFK